MTDAVKTAIVGGVLALLGAVGGAAITGWSQVQLAKQKFDSDLVLKALESSSSDQRLESLKLLTETNLLKDSDIKEGVQKYAKAKESNPKSIPQVKSSGDRSFDAPIISNPRIYLLAGNKLKEPLFSVYKAQLELAGYKVLGAKILNNEGRPAHEEVRYFNSSDQAQAEKIAEVVKFKLSIADLPAREYSDPSVNIGYIEIWFGK